jgi:hypothetical protein
MPNWTDNHIRITGKAEDVKRFLNDVVSYDSNPDDTPDEIINLTNVNPVPDIFNNMHSGHRKIDDVSYTEWWEDEDGVRPVMDITRQELIDKYGSANALDWQYANWGTKWGDCETEMTNPIYTDTTGTVDMTFSSAWGPPFMLLNDIAIKYNLEITSKWIVEFEDDENVDKYPLTLHETDELYKNHRQTLETMKESISGI